jgi:hypothetical protein
VSQLTFRHQLSSLLRDAATIFRSLASTVDSFADCTEVAMSLRRRTLAMSAVIAAGVAVCTSLGTPLGSSWGAAAPAAASPPLSGCRANSVSNAYFTLSLKRALLSCNVTEVGITGHALPDGAADLSVWGPDNFQHLTRAEAGVYKTVWRGDHAPGSRWYASFVGDGAEISLLA